MRSELRPLRHRKETIYGGIVNAVGAGVWILALALVVASFYEREAAQVVVVIAEVAIIALFYRLVALFYLA